MDKNKDVIDEYQLNLELIDDFVSVQQADTLLRRGEKLKQYNFNTERGPFIDFCRDYDGGEKGDIDHGFQIREYSDVKEFVFRDIEYEFNDGLFSGTSFVLKDKIAEKKIAIKFYINFTEEELIIELSYRIFLTEEEVLKLEKIGWGDSIVR